MNVLKPYLVLLLLLLSSRALLAGEQVDRLLSEYARIETVTCQIRRTKEGKLGKKKFLSRVYWTNKDQLHSEGIAPVKRRTIVDGKRLWQYAQGDPKGFARPISDLTEQMTISLKMVPGTAMDQLLRLKDLPETLLADDGSAEKRIGIEADGKYVVLRFDEQHRLKGMTFYVSAKMDVKLADYVYRDFTEAVSGVWVPLTHEVSFWKADSEFTETVKVDRFVANKPVAESLFIASSFFSKNIDFVDEFAKIYPE